MSDQLDFFGAPTPVDAQAVEPAQPSEQLRGLGERLAANFHFGTSSWSFPGWEGLVYARAAGTSRLAKRGLEAYARHPLFRSVGVDRTFYAPVEAELLRRYAQQVPDDFRFLVKAFGGCTSARNGLDTRFGPAAGKANPHFLDPSYASDVVVAPFVEGLGHKAGVLLFQFSPQALAPMGGPRAFPDRLHDFFAALPRLEHGHYAVELRNAELFTPRYLRAIGEVGVQHCINALPGMQSVAKQFAATGGARRDALIIRWMLHPKHDYQGAKLAYAPFDRIVDEDLETRGAIVDALREASADGPRRSFLIVNNKAEGSSPKSIERVVEALVGGW